MRRAVVLAVALSGLACSAPMRAKLAEMVKPRTSKSASKAAAKTTLVGRATIGSLTVGKWRLGNGLEVILAPDPTARSVSYTTWFRVGSRHENAGAGETGLAHLFEHLMFTQTKSARQEGEFDQRMEEIGGNANAMTSQDFTAYTDDLPPGALPLAIEMEADRMVNLALVKKQVETERDVVVEERLSAVEDSVEGLLDEMMHMQAFKTHPYRFPVIGLMKDIKAVTPEKATRFYETYYAPNNAVIVAAGLFDETATLDRIAREYGALEPSSRLPSDALVPERAPAQAVRAQIVRPVPADRFVVGLPSPALAAADRPAYELLAEILLGGPSSRLQHQLIVEKELASSVTGDVPDTKDPAIFGLWVQMRKGHVAAEAEAVIEPELARLITQAVPAAELERARTRLETALWRSLTGSDGKAERLGEFDVCGGDYRKLFERPPAWAQVTSDELQRVARTYFGPETRSVVVATPKPE